MRQPKAIVRNVAIAAVAINSPVLVAQWFALSAGGNTRFISLTSWLINPVLLSLLLVPLLVFLLLKQELRRVVLVLLIGCMIYGFVGWSIFYIASIYRMSRFADVAQQSEYLVDAIRRYEIDKGAPPARLDDLVPAYIPGMPETGLGAYPAYGYQVTNEYNRQLTAGPWFNRLWLLYIDIPLQDGHGEKFIYFPPRDIPEQWEQTIVQRMDDWVYVRE